MLPFLIVGLAQIGLAAGKRYYEAKENEKMRKESRGLAMTMRDDDLKKQNDMNKLNRQSLDLGQRQVNFNNKMADMTIGAKEDQKKYIEDSTFNSIRKNTAQRMLDPGANLTNRRRYI